MKEFVHFVPKEFNFSRESTGKIWFRSVLSSRGGERERERESCPVSRKTVARNFDRVYYIKKTNAAGLLFLIFNSFVIERPDRRLGTSH